MLYGIPEDSNLMFICNLCNSDYIVLNDWMAVINEFVRDVEGNGHGVI
jgi:hypothetical protein